MAEILAEQYNNMFSTPRKNIQRINLKTNAKLQNLLFTETDIIHAIDELKTNAASGPDGFPAFFLKQCKHALSTPLAIFWKSCFNNGSIPASLKRGVIIPVFKNGLRSLPANYRPIALTSHLIKAFEKVIIRNVVVAYMDENNLFNESQHGLRAGRSCLSQLLDHFCNILDNLEYGVNVDVIYLNFA